VPEKNTIFAQKMKVERFMSTHMQEKACKIRVIYNNFVFVYRRSEPWVMHVGYKKDA
jgi:hypothetical protein